jgi:group I intron endonuclease
MNNSGIYKIICLIDYKIYIGSAKNLDKRWRRHLNDLKSGKHINIHLQRAFNKYGIENFRFEILEICDYDSILQREQFYLDKFRPFEIGFNIGSKSSGGDNLTNNPNREKIILKIKNSINKNISKMSKEERKRSNPGKFNPNFRKKWSEEQKNKASENQKNNPNNHFKLNKNKTNIEIYGKDKAMEISKKLSNHASTRTGEKNPFFNKKHSKESKDKISKSRKGKKPTNRKKISIKEIIYESYADASKSLNIPIVTIRWRCLSKNSKFESYKLI